MENFKYTIIRTRTRRISAKLNIKTGVFEVKAPLFYPKSEIEKFLFEHRRCLEKDYLSYEKEKNIAEKERISDEEIKEYRKIAPEHFRKLADKYASILGVQYKNITIRMQKTRWGSCSIKGNLNFNLLLFGAPAEVLESVVAHEICHLKNMNHSKRFYDDLLKIFPNYRECDKWLKENGRVLQMKFGLFDK